MCIRNDNNIYTTTIKLKPANILYKRQYIKNGAIKKRETETTAFWNVVGSSALFAAVSLAEVKD